MIERVFDGWDPRVIRLRDEPVHVNVLRLWPDVGTSLYLAPRDVRLHGLRLEAFHAGRLTAWVRLTTGQWIAVVEATACSGDGAVSAPLVLWVPGAAVRRSG